MEMNVGVASLSDSMLETFSSQDQPQKYSGMQAMVMSLMVILVSEIGDKTFLIAAVMAMQHPRLMIFSAAIAALLVMTVLSALMGQVLPQLISKSYSEIAAALLFFVFV
jgi:Ca2+/H+ antiporter, TMEM165/GDT1 family